MERIDRRAFLATGIRTGVVLAAGGTAAGIAAADPSRPPAEPAATADGSDDQVPRPPVGLLTTGSASPVGVDPDDVQFAWRVTDGRRRGAARPPTGSS